MPRSTIYEDSRSPESATSSRTLSRPSTRVKNDQKWDAQKDEIYRLYIEADNTLEATIQMIGETSGFKARKWKMKLKEWRFEKNLSKHDMEIIVAKARKRSRDESKNTIFFYGATQIRPERIENFKKRKTASDKYVVSSRSDTPERDLSDSESRMLPSGRSFLHRLEPECIIFFTNSLQYLDALQFEPSDSQLINSAQTESLNDG
ncbi:uncharacterized protein RAG0_00475 [Rhynchosporium agropyri]|uniref:Clr5 domain-containing protein n=1 Tax=Rhynchosporium agropyri TaxID=914238 RepID=A0A1E1JT28_9HELO|nr:uncharacterized protein RAG0_00475 [Rhynchosporium agropyri]